MKAIFDESIPIGKYFVLINAGKLWKIESNGNLTDFSNMISFIYHDLKLKEVDRDGDIFHNLLQEEEP